MFFYPTSTPFKNKNKWRWIIMEACSEGVKWSGKWPFDLLCLYFVILRKAWRKLPIFQTGFCCDATTFICAFLYSNKFICAGNRWYLWRIRFAWWKTEPWYYSDASDAQWPDSILQYNFSPSYVFILQINKTGRRHFWRKCWGWIWIVVLHSLHNACSYHIYFQLIILDFLMLWFLFLGNLFDVLCMG